MPFRSPELHYGDTWGDEGAGRRIRISSIPSNTRVQNILDWFGPDTVEGVSIINKNPHHIYAFVQFKRPQGHTEALLRNHELFMGQKITIRNYSNPSNEPNKIRMKHRASLEAGEVRLKYEARYAVERRRSRSPPRRPTRDRSPPRRPTRDRSPIRSHAQSPARQRRSSRCRERSRSRSPARSLSIATEIYQRAMSKSPTKNTAIANIQPNLYSSKEMDNQDDDLLARQTVAPAHWTQHIPNHQFAMAPAQFQPPVSVNNTVTTNRPITNSDDRDLPADVQLLLQIILEQGTANQLSLFQINKVIQYFEATRLKIERPSLIQMPPSSENAMRPLGITNNNTTGPVDETETAHETAQKIAEKIRKLYS